MASHLHTELCLRAAKFLQNNGFSVVFDDRFQAVTGAGELPDAIGFRNGCSCLIEAKVSRGDYLADKKKHFRKEPEQGMGDWRFFICPPGLIKPEEVSTGWGLLYAYPKQIRKVKGFPPNTQWGSGKPFSSNKQAECDFLYSALRRLQIRGHFESVYEQVQALQK